jgi:Methyltransferase domain
LLGDNVVLQPFKRLIGRAVRSQGYELRRQQQTSRLVFPQIPGWFSIVEGELLYLLSTMCTGPILEIGHCMGRSTSAICEGIRDSGRTVEFDSYDLGFRSPDEFIAFYTKLYQRGNFDVPPEVNDLVYSRKATTSEIARENLTRFGLNSYVRLISGDFSQDRPKAYDLIFCDALHDAVEIQQNLPSVIARSGSHCTWAFHDMTEANTQLVQRMVPHATFLTRGDTLGVFRYVQDRPAGGHVP